MFSILLIELEGACNMMRDGIGLRSNYHRLSPFSHLYVTVALINMRMLRAACSYSGFDRCRSLCVCCSPYMVPHKMCRTIESSVPRNGMLLKFLLSCKQNLMEECRR